MWLGKLAAALSNPGGTESADWVALRLLPVCAIAPVLGGTALSWPCWSVTEGGTSPVPEPGPGPDPTAKRLHQCWEAQHSAGHVGQ